MYRYHELLSRAMDEQGLTLQKMADRCAEVSGGSVNYDITTFSRLRSAKQKPPLEPTEKELKQGRLSPNRVIAQVAGIPEDKFLLAAALEHTPTPALQHVAIQVLALIGDVRTRALNGITGAIEVLKRTKEEVSDTNPDLAESLGMQEVILQAEAWRVTEGMAALVMVTDPYLEVADSRTPVGAQTRDAESHALLKDVTADSLTRTLADAAGIPERDLRIYIKTAQLIQAEERAEQEMRRQSLHTALTRAANKAKRAQKQ